MAAFPEARRPPYASATPESRLNILGMRLDTLAIEDCLALIDAWLRARTGRYVCLANSHMAVETCRSDDYRDVVNAADLVLSDGRPLVWAAKLLGTRGQTQIRGTDLVLALCDMAERRGLGVGFLGATPAVLATLLQEIARRHPKLSVCYSESPPFRPLSRAEEEAMVLRITAAAPALLFVGLGCPRQERWMARHKPLIAATMLGVGAAFDLIAGAKRQAPPWMQRAGLEWAFRLAQEPRRLFRRYAYTNTYFVIRLAAQLLATRRARGAERVARPKVTLASFGRRTKPTGDSRAQY
jgi:N-acetylglucosaminyldiphosphoundecaprenol N-acetyl-beta-D-mannosaminyltransferase